MFSAQNNEISICDCLQFVESFDVFCNGNITKFQPDNDEFLIIKQRLIDIFQSARLMPAFGVSLHNETLNELKYNKWLQINFKKEQTKNGLIFNSLLFKLEQTSGFNLIRLYNNKYEGRCIYLDLGENIDLNSIVEFI